MFIMSESQQKALTVLIQSIITAVLLFIQSFFLQSCMTAQGDINKSTDVSVPISIDYTSNNYQSLFDYAKDLGIPEDDDIMQMLKALDASNPLNPNGVYYGN